MRTLATALVAAALAAVPAAANQMLPVGFRPICDGTTLVGLRGHVPAAGRVTIYITPGMCADNAAPLRRPGT